MKVVLVVVPLFTPLISLVKAVAPNDAELVLQVGSIRFNQTSKPIGLNHGTSQCESTGSKAPE